MSDEVAVNPPVEAPAEPRSVTMSDGRQVTFGAKQKAQKEALQDADGSFSGARWDFANGETRTILLSELTPLVVSGQLAVHGLLQKGGDEYASSKTVEDAVFDFDNLMDRLRQGEWREEREGGVGGLSSLAKAIMEVYQLSAEKAREFLRSCNRKEQEGLKVAPEFKPVIDRIEAEKASKVDVSSKLAALRAGISG